MNKSTFLKLAESRFSCRKFTSAGVEPCDIDQILQAAIAAPTAMNKQPLHVWVVKSPEALLKLKEATQYTYDAPVVFMVGCDPSKAWVRKYDGKNGAEVDAAIVGTHIMMEAADLGLGSVWVGSFDPAKIKTLFPQTAGYEMVALFPVGHPAVETSSLHAVRKPKEEFVSEI
jgi:nitroreductase